MQHIQGISRHQLQMSSLEDKISVDNSVCFIDAFVNHTNSRNLGKGKQDKNCLKATTKKEVHMPLAILSKIFTISA